METEALSPEKAGPLTAALPLEITVRSATFEPSTAVSGLGVAGDNKIKFESVYLGDV